MCGYRGGGVSLVVMKEENAVKIIRTWIKTHPIHCPTQNVIDLKLAIIQLLRGDPLIRCPLFPHPTIVQQDDLDWLKGAFLVVVVYKNTFARLNGYTGNKTPIIKSVLEEERDTFDFDFLLGECFSLD